MDKGVLQKYGIICPDKKKTTKQKKNSYTRIIQEATISSSKILYFVDEVLLL
jgi:hypothetical protein